MMVSALSPSPLSTAAKWEHPSQGPSPSEGKKGGGSLRKGTASTTDPHHNRFAKHRIASPSTFALGQV